MWSKLVGMVTGNLLPYITVATVTVSIASLAALWIVTNKYDNLMVEAASKLKEAEGNQLRLETALAKQNTDILNLSIALTEERTNTKYREDLLATLRSDLNKQRMLFDDYKNRWQNAAARKPATLSRLINAATTKHVMRVQALTCRANCDTGESPGNNN